MNVSVFGLGYVGAVTAGCLSGRGCRVIGVDVHELKVADINAGRSPIVEPGLEERLSGAVEKGLLSATQSCAEAISKTEISLVCVGTPSDASGALELKYVRQVSLEIAEAVREKNQRHSLIFRSTMLPGSVRSLVADVLHAEVEDGLIDVYSYPEFLREGSAVRDFENPSLTLIGASDGGTISDAVRELVGSDGEVTTWEVAESLKYACNAFHAAKVAFANEIGRIGRAVGVDSRAVMRLVCEDTTLNISKAYLRPGAPFGGSCLPKDLRALNSLTRTIGVETPMLESLLASNRAHQDLLLNALRESGQSAVVLIGLSFKSNTDDLRESPMVELAQQALGRGFDLKIYDKQLNLAQLVGANKREIDRRMPHLASLLMDDVAHCLETPCAVIVSQKHVDIETLCRVVTERHHIIDLVGWPELESLPSVYQGFLW